MMHKTWNARDRNSKALERLLDKKHKEKAMPIIYTPSNEEVAPAYNIRTDKWEVAIDAMQRIYEKQQSK